MRKKRGFSDLETLAIIIFAILVMILIGIAVKDIIGGIRG